MATQTCICTEDEKIVLETSSASLQINIKDKGFILADEFRVFAKSQKF